MDDIAGMLELAPRSEAAPSQPAWQTKEVVMSRGGGGQFGFSLRNGVAVVQVPSELDLSNQGHLRDCCRAAIDAVSTGGSGARVVVDLSGTTYMDSSALSVFVQIAKHVASEGGWLRLASADSPVLRKVLAITQLKEYLGDYDRVDDAAGGLRASHPSTIPSMRRSTDFGSTKRPLMPLTWRGVHVPEAM